jgi:hypothetical protein
MRLAVTDIITPPNLSFPEIYAFFTTRDTDDRIFKRFPLIFLPVQKHTDRIHILDNVNDDAVVADAVVADAVITQKKNVLIGIQVADCVPILLYDKGRGVIGAVHAGWRGTAKGILRSSINMMCEAFDSSTDEILIAIGPSIRDCCYEVGPEVIKEIECVTGNGEYYKVADNSFYLDLLKANIIQALSTGVSEENIWHSEECTSCNPERFYSYRYSGGKTGRQGGFIGIW